MSLLFLLWMITSKSILCILGWGAVHWQMYCDCLKEIAEAITVEQKKKKTIKGSLDVVFTLCTQTIAVLDSAFNVHTLMCMSISHFLFSKSEYESPPTYFRNSHPPHTHSIAGQLSHAKGEYYVWTHYLNSIRNTLWEILFTVSHISVTELQEPSVTLTHPQIMHNLSQKYQHQRKVIQYFILK